METRTNTIKDFLKINEVLKKGGNAGDFRYNRTLYQVEKKLIECGMRIDKYQTGSLNYKTANEYIHELAEKLEMCEIFLEKIDKIQKNKKIENFKDWAKENPNQANCGYKMGGSINIVYVDEVLQHKVVLFNNNEKYTGRASAYNRNISYGNISLVVDFSGKRSKIRFEQNAKKGYEFTKEQIEKILNK